MKLRNYHFTLKNIYVTFSEIEKKMLRKEIPQFQRFNPPKFVESLEYDSAKFPSLSEFLKNLNDGTFVEISEGNYELSANISKILYIRGNGKVTFTGNKIENIINSSSNYLVLENINFDQKSSKSGNCINVSGGYLRVIGCTFTSRDDIPIVATNNSSLELLNCASLGCQNTTLMLNIQAKCLCERCIFGKCQSNGITLRGNSTLYISKCNISQNNVNGIKLQDSASAVIVQSVIQSNVHAGIESTSNGTILLRHSLIKDHQAHGVLLSSGHIDIIQSTILDNKRSAVSVFHNTATAFLKQSKLENADNGELLQCSGSNVEIDGGIITGKCEAAAISIKEGGHVILKNLSILDIPGNGILTDSKASITIDNIGIKGAKMAGCQFNGNVECGGKGLIITECQKGIQAEELKAYIDQVTIFNCADNLIHLKKGSEGKLTNVRLSDSNSVMVLLQDSKMIFQAAEFTGKCTACIGIMGAESKPQFLNSVFAPDSDKCFYMQNDADVELSQCAIKCKKVGVMIKNAKATLNEVQISECSFGIFMNKGEMQIDKSIITQNQRGISISEPNTKITITNSVISQNEIIGISAVNEAIISMDHCQVTDNKLHIQAATKAQAFIVACEIFSSRSGFGCLSKGAIISIKDSSLHDERSVSLNIEALSACEVINSAILRCGVSGVCVKDGSRFITSGTSYEGNENCGIYIYDTSQAQIVNCVFQRHTAASIMRASSASIITEGNNYLDNRDIMIQ